MLKTITIGSLEMHMSSTFRLPGRLFNQLRTINMETSIWRGSPILHVDLDELFDNLTAINIRPYYFSDTTDNDFKLINIEACRFSTSLFNSRTEFELTSMGRYNSPNKSSNPNITRTKRELQTPPHRIIHNH